MMTIILLISIIAMLAFIGWQVNALYRFMRRSENLKISAEKDSLKFYRKAFPQYERDSVQ